MCTNVENLFLQMLVDGIVESGLMLHLFLENCLFVCLFRLFGHVSLQAGLRVVHNLTLKKSFSVSFSKCILIYHCDLCLLFVFIIQETVHSLCD